MNEIESSIVENARSYTEMRRPQYQSSSGRYTSFFQQIHNHYEGMLLPALLSSGERLVEYYPCFAIVEARTDSRRRDTYSSQTYQGKYGCGYICFTDRNVRLVVLGALRQRYRPFSGGLLGIVSGIFGNAEHYSVTALAADETWTMPAGSILDCRPAMRISVQVVELTTEYGKFDILNVYTDDLEKIYVALHMARTGKLSAIWASARPPRSRPHSEQESAEET